MTQAARKILKDCPECRGLGADFCVTCWVAEVGFDSLGPDSIGILTHLSLARKLKAFVPPNRQKALSYAEGLLRKALAGLEPADAVIETVQPLLEQWRTEQQGVSPLTVAAPPVQTPKKPSAQKPPSDRSQKPARTTTSAQEANRKRIDARLKGHDDKVLAAIKKHGSAQRGPITKETGLTYHIVRESLLRLLEKELITYQGDGPLRAYSAR